MIRTTLKRSNCHSQNPGPQVLADSNHLSAGQLATENLAEGIRFGRNFMDHVFDSMANLATLSATELTLVAGHQNSRATFPMRSRDPSF